MFPFLQSLCTDQRDGAPGRTLSLATGVHSSWGDQALAREENGAEPLESFGVVDGVSPAEAAHSLSVPGRKYQQKMENNHQNTSKTMKGWR